MLKLIDKLKKIQALAESGIGGERENAKVMLDELCQRHGVTMDQLIDDELIVVEFVVKDKLQDKLLMNVVAHICQTGEVRYKKHRNHRWFRLTRIQKIDVQECFKHYLDCWEKELLDMMRAFIHTNNIYGPNTDDEKSMPDAEQIEKLKKILAIMAGMEPNPWKKRLALER